MGHRNVLFLMVGLVLVGALVRPSGAVPTVKKLGVSNSNSNIQSSNSVKTTKATSSTMQRAPSVRYGTASTKPVTKMTSGTSVLKAKAKTTTDNIENERLSAIHKNLLKIGVGAGGNTPQTQAVENSELFKRVENLEGKMDIKQDILQAGDGIEIKDNVISLSEEIMTDLGDKVDIANLSENYYNIGQTQEYLSQNYYDKTYVDQIVSQLSGANVVSQFDPSFLHQNQGN